LNFTTEDITQIKNNGLTPEKVTAQIQLFKTGIAPINLKDAATINNGILSYSDAEKDAFISHFIAKKDDISILKFVPSSGAASRMFKFLFKFLKEYNPQKESVNSYINKNKVPEMTLFLFGMNQFPFYEKTKALLPSNYSSLNDDEKAIAFVKTILDTDGLNYGAQPKGLLPFHQYKNEISTAFQEHLFEAASYSSSNNKAKLHFTISENHKQKFEAELNRIQQHVSQKTNTTFEVSFSYQKHETDTIAVTPKNEIFREQDDSLLFRPSGHGALIENLNEVNDDLIFIKNIDNVVAENLSETVASYKKMLGGILLKLQDQVFIYQRKLKEETLDEAEIITIANFLINKLNVVINPEFEKYATKYQIAYLYEKMHRPIRVCGMVKNEGEPGGGPFWVKSESGAISLQIVESAQINKENKRQTDILKSATHFNPVDLVCGIKDYTGKKHNLIDFVDENTGFISAKTKLGKDLKALELPGLWNGAMANWNTIFVEVPLETFNPVKTVNDLLKPAHQA